MDNSEAYQNRLDILANSTPLRIDLFSVKEFDTSSPLPVVKEPKVDYFGLALKIFAIVFTFFAGLVILSFPKAKVLSFVKNILVFTPEVKTSLKNLGGSVEEYYDFLLGKESPSKLLLRVDIGNFLSDLEGVVAGAAVERRTMLSLGYQPLFYLERAQEDFQAKKEKEDVLGENTFFQSKLENLLREGKELSAKILDNSKAASIKLEEFEKFVKEEDPGGSQQSLRLLISDIRQVNEEARNFISQAKKTGNYYYIIYDINIELTPYLVNYIEVLKKIGSSSDPSLYLSQLDDFQYNLLKLQARLKRVSGEQLPYGLEDLHNDNLRIFELLTDNVKEVKASLTQGRQDQINYLLAKLISALKPVYERSKTLEINFWQNNRSLRRYSDLIKKYEELEGRLQQFILKHQNLFLEYLSGLVG